MALPGAAKTRIFCHLQSASVTRAPITAVIFTRIAWARSL